eukprot:4564385-Pyramimonas_sp.AAC.2
MRTQRPGRGAEGGVGGVADVVEGGVELLALEGRQRRRVRVARVADGPLQRAHHVVVVEHAAEGANRQQANPRQSRHRRRHVFASRGPAARAPRCASGVGILPRGPR